MAHKRLIFELTSCLAGEIDVCQKILTGQLSIYIVNVKNFCRLPAIQSSRPESELIELSIRQTFWQLDSCLKFEFKFGGKHTKLQAQLEMSLRRSYCLAHIAYTRRWLIVFIIVCLCFFWRFFARRHSKHSIVPQFDPVWSTIRTTGPAQHHNNYESLQLQFWMSQLLSSFEAFAKFMRTICEIYCNDNRLVHNSFPAPWASLFFTFFPPELGEQETGNHWSLFCCFGFWDFYYFFFWMQLLQLTPTCKMRQEG